MIDQTDLRIWFERATRDELDAYFRATVRPKRLAIVRPEPPRSRSVWDFEISLQGILSVGSGVTPKFG
jgi:hypothetical protein